MQKLSRSVHARLPYRHLLNLMPDPRHRTISTARSLHLTAACIWLRRSFGEYTISEVLMALQSFTWIASNIR